MKKILLVLLILNFSNNFSQENATLGIGLESLTFNKGTIDVEVLTKIILKKQKELKNEALKRFMFKMFPESDYTTRFYVQNCLNILLNEKNPQVIEKEILELTTNYAIALGVTQALTKMNGVFNDLDDKKNKHINYEKILKKINHEEKLNSLETKIGDLHTKNEKLAGLSKNLKQNKESIKTTIREIEKLENNIKRIKRQLARKGVKYDLTNTETINNTSTLTFGEKLDIVSLALSENDLLRKKGFFKNKIDYRADQGYFITASVDNDLIIRINEKINPYIENYDIIKNFLENIDLKSNEFKNVTNINDALTNIYLNQLESFDDFENLIKNNSLNNYSKFEIENFNYLVKLKNDYAKLNEFKNKLSLVNLKKTPNTNLNIISNVALNDDLNLKILPVIDDFRKFKNEYTEILKTNNSISEIKAIIESINNNPQISGLNIVNLKNISLRNDKEENTINSKIDKILKSIETIEIKTISNEDETTEINNLINNINQEINSINKIKSKENFIIGYNFSNILDLEHNITNINNLNIEDINIKLDSKILDVQKIISNKTNFFDVYINTLLKKIDTSSLSQSTIASNDNDKNEVLSNLITKIYERLNYFKNSKNYNISDINYLEKELLPQLVGLKYADIKENQPLYENLIKGLKNLTPLLKIRILSDKKLNVDLFNYKEIISLFEFIGNLDKLDKAQTYASIIALIQKNSEDIFNVLPDGEFKDSYKIFINGVKKYTLINPNAEKEYVEIDVVSFLDDLQQYYNRKNPSSFSLYLTIGLNQNFFFNDFKFPDTEESINNIGFASEKIGLKYKILDFSKDRNYENVIKSDVYLNRRAPFINEWYVSAYGSGLLYSLANTSTNANFNFPHFGISTGFRFYNALDFNIMLGLPFVKDEKFGDNGFFGIGFDIPLGEYLEALGNK